MRKLHRKKFKVVTFAAKSPASWPGEKVRCLEEAVKEAFAGAEKWLYDQLKRIDEEFELERI